MSPPASDADGDGVSGLPEFKTVDLSQAHFLDHPLWRCRGLPGGRVRHLKYRWQYQWQVQLLRLTFCRMGHHSPVTMWRGAGPNAVKFRACRTCLTRLIDGKHVN